MNQEQLNENTICVFLEQAIEELKKILPPAYHQWERTKLTREDNGCKLTLSTKPDFYLFIWKKSLESTKKLTNILNSDIGLWTKKKTVSRLISAKQIIV